MMIVNGKSLLAAKPVSLMIGWLKNIFAGPQVMIIISDPDREASVSAMQHKQEELQRTLGISGTDDVQAWLRLHEILHDYEERLKALETPKPRVGRTKK